MCRSWPPKSKSVVVNYEFLRVFADAGHIRVRLRLLQLSVEIDTKDGDLYLLQLRLYGKVCIFDPLGLSSALPNLITKDFPFDRPLEVPQMKRLQARRDT